MPRRSNKEINEIKAYIAGLILNRQSEITKNDGSISYKKISGLIKDELDYSMDEHTVARYAKSDLGKYKDVVPTEENENIKSLEKRIKLAKQIADDKSEKTRDRTSALNTYNALMKTKLKYEQMLAEERIKKAEVSRPVYKIIFGHFENVIKTCPKCGHRFYDPSYLKNEKKFKLERKEKIEDVNNRQDSERRKIKFESGKGQSTFDRFSKDS